MNNPIRYVDPTGHVVSETDKANLSKAQQDQLNKLTEDYKKAEKIGDTAGMKKANEEANKIRESAGYTGGANGDSIVVKSGNTVNKVVIADTTTVNNKGTITTLDVLTGATTSITNNGTITTINNNGTINNINNSGTITTINNNGSIGSINNSGTITMISNTSSGNIGKITNVGSIGTVSNNGTITMINNMSNGTVDKITSSGAVGTIQNSGTIGSITNAGSGSIGTIDNIGTVGSIYNASNARTGTIKNTGSIDAVNNRGTINALENMAGGNMPNVSNTGTINSIYIGNADAWYFLTEFGAIENFQSIYTSGTYAEHEYATYTYAIDLFGGMYYGYATPNTVKMDNFVPPPVWGIFKAISFLHTHPNRDKAVHSHPDITFVELVRVPYYVVTSKDYKIYEPTVISEEEFGYWSYWIFSENNYNHTGIY